MSEQPQPPREAAFFTAIREWGLVRADGVFGGVASGIGSRWGLAPTPSRLLAVIAAITLPGLVLLAYAAAWALLPDRNGRIIIQDFGRGVTNVGALLGIAVMAIVGLFTLDRGSIFTGWNGAVWWYNVGPFELMAAFFSTVIPLAVLIGIIVLVTYLVKRNKKENQAAASTPPAPVSPEPSAAATPAPAQSAPSAPSAPAAEPAPVPVPATASAHAVASDPAPASAPHSPGATAHAWNATTGAPTTPPVAPQKRPPGPTAPRTTPRVPGPGKGAWLALLGVMLVSGAGVLIAERTTGLAVPWPLAWFAGFAVGLGLILVVVALAGRRLGFLGFLSVLVLIAGVALSANSNDLTTAYDQARVDLGLDTVEVDPPPPGDFPQDITVVEAFGEDYASVYVDGQCKAYPTDWEPSDDDGIGFTNRIPNAATRVDDLTTDTTIDLRADVTTIDVPTNTSLSVTGVNGQVVDWPERRVYCEVWSEAANGPVIELINPDTSVLTLNAREGGTIYINEEVTP